MNPSSPSVPLLLALAILVSCAACGASRAPLEAPMAPLRVGLQSPPAPLTANHFQGDTSGLVNEEAIREILAAPVFLEAQARIGVVPVGSGYALDPDLPVNTVTGALTEALEKSGQFEVTSEVTTDWPTDLGVAGLRALATRYRCEYLLLYRHRFAEQEWTNAWGLTWVAILPVFFVPANSFEAAGVLEATLFDVKSGTLLFTVHTRVKGEAARNIWGYDGEKRALKERLLSDATASLVGTTMGKISRLAAARPRGVSSVAQQNAEP